MSQFACPSCHRVVEHLLRIRYGDGMLDVGPIDRCPMCVESLRALENDHADGVALGAAIWGVEVLETLDAASEPREEPTRRRRTWPVDRTRTSRGGVGV